jgi:hypothetical protein
MRILFIVPKMYSFEDLSIVNSSVPEDYQSKARDFWDYVNEKLNPRRDIRKVYFDALTLVDLDKGLEFVKQAGVECYELIYRFVDKGAELIATEDSLLVQESASWISMLGESGVKEMDNLATREMLAKNMVDRNKYVAMQISKTLKEGETGLLVLAPGRYIDNELPGDIKVIKVQPFDPLDYLNSWLVTLSLKRNNKNDDAPTQKG